MKSIPLQGHKRFFFAGGAVPESPPDPSASSAPAHLGRPSSSQDVARERSLNFDFTTNFLGDLEQVPQLGVLFYLFQSKWVEREKSLGFPDQKEAQKVIFSTLCQTILSAIFREGVLPYLPTPCSPPSIFVCY